MIEELYNGKETSFVHALSNERNSWEMGTEYARGLLRLRNYDIVGANKNSEKMFNIWKEDKDIQNGNGWSTMVTRKKLPVIKGNSNIGLFMVNLTKVSFWSNTSIVNS